MRVFLRVYPIVFFITALLGGTVTAQDLNPTLVEAKILQGELFEFDFISNKPISIIAEENTGGGIAETEEVSINIDYKFSYQSSPDFVGESRFVIERSSFIGSYKVYTEIKIKVVPSLLEAIRDVALLPSNSTQVTVDVLANDIPGNGNSTVVGVELVSDGSAQIINNQVVFTKVAGFQGQTSFNYRVQDASGYRSSGVVTINAQGNTTMAGTSLEYMTSNVSSIDIIIDDSSYDLNGNAYLDYGTLTRTGPYVFTYTPALSSIGNESFVLTNSSGGEVSVQIEILDDGGSTVLVRDDEFFTSVGTTVVFDPRQNDHSQEGVLIDYSDALTYDGSMFTYVPESGYSGVKEFYYTILDGQKEVTGIIEIYIGNYLPQLDNYSFETYKNTPFVIEYPSPINDYQWNLVSGPSSGELSVNVGTYASPSCTVISGNRMVIYIPDNGFTGIDQFVIEYCVNNGACKQVAVAVNVIPSNENCACFGDDCVWAGDADNDGKVSVKDILAIGYNYGETGAARNVVSDEWGAKHALDWPFAQSESAINNKFADSNGDGIISVADAAVLNNHINAYHNINAQEVLAQKDLPLTFVPRSLPLQVGLNIFDVYIGSSTIPAEDLKGVAFSTQFPLDIVNPSSIKFIPSPEWIGNGSPILTAIDVNNGLLSVGIARTSEIGVYGEGRIGETRIVLDDYDGTRPGGSELPIDIVFKSALANNNRGKSFKIAPQSLSLKLELENRSVDVSPVVVVFPNPSVRQLSFYANNNDQLIDIHVYNMMGALVAKRIDINATTFEMQHLLPQGIYSAAIKTQRGLTVQKIQVISDL